MLSKRLTVGSLAVMSALYVAQPALACPVCFGASDSPLAAGVNWGVLLLLAVTGGVLAGFVSFFVYLFKRSRAVLGEPIEGARPVRHEGSY